MVTSASASRASRASRWAVGHPMCDWVPVGAATFLEAVRIGSDFRSGLRGAGRSPSVEDGVAQDDPEGAGA